MYIVRSKICLVFNYVQNQNSHMHTHHLVTKWQTIRTDSSICIQVEYLCHIMYVEGFVA